MMNMNNLAQTHEILTPQLATKVGLTKFEFYKYVKEMCIRDSYMTTFKNTV